jgi:hypothetical protein
MTGARRNRVDNGQASWGDLARRVQLLEDQEAIRDLGCAYHALGCERDTDAMAELFAEDAEVDYGQWGLIRGRDAVREMVRKAIADDDWVPFTMQFIQNHRYELTADSGTGRRYNWCCLVHNDESYVCIARFDDEYRKTNGRWFFQKVTMKVYFWNPLREGWAEAVKDVGHLAEAQSHMN